MKSVKKTIATVLAIGFLVFCACILILLIIGNNAGSEIKAALWLTAILLILCFARYCKLNSLGPLRAIGHLALSGIVFTAKILNVDGDSTEESHDKTGIGWHQLNQEWHFGIDDPFVLHDEE